MRAYHEFERHMEQEKPFCPYREVLTRSLLQAASRTGIVLPETQAGILPECWNTMPVFPDTEAMLDELRTMHCRLAVLTNCDDDLFDQTQRKFSKPFDLVVTAERVRDYKPSLTHFKTFVELSGTSHRDWVHVACSFYHDIEPARRFGARAIWLDRDKTGEDPAAASARVQTAREVSEAIRRWR